MLPLCLSLKVCILKVYHLVCLFEYDSIWICMSPYLFEFVRVCFYIWTLSLFEYLFNYLFVWIYLNFCLYEFIWKFEGLYVWIILFEFWRFVCLSLNLCVMCMSIVCVHYIWVFVCVWVMCHNSWILCLKFSNSLVVKQLPNNGKSFFSCILKDFIT
jgi:hypothetical protein